MENRKYLKLKGDQEDMFKILKKHDINIKNNKKDIDKLKKVKGEKK